MPAPITGAGAGLTTTHAEQVGTAWAAGTALMHSQIATANNLIAAPPKVNQAGSHHKLPIWSTAYHPDLVIFTAAAGRIATAYSGNLDSGDSRIGRALPRFQRVRRRSSPFSLALVGGSRGVGAASTRSRLRAVVRPGAAVAWA